MFARERAPVLEYGPMRYLFGSYFDLDRPLRRWQELYTRGNPMTNPGDMVYAAGMMDVLRTGDGDEFVPTGYCSYNGGLPLSLDEINATCAACVLPFADHFRDSRRGLLYRYEALIRKLKIPVVVPCIGVRDGEVTKKTDAAVKRFVSAVLDKSALIGLRGETTARYLEKLGYRRDRHFTVVGCPSIYAAGPELPAMVWPEKPESCAFGLNRRAGETVNRFLFDSAGAIPRRRYISQGWLEFTYNFISPRVRREATHRLPWFRDMLDSALREGYYRYFYNLNDWKRCLRSCDCSLSCRIHGTILALRCGVPSAIVPFESRTRELAEFHAIPIIPPEEIDPGDTVAKFTGRFDFDTMRRRHRENFAAFADFLHRNGLRTAFDGGGSGARPSPGQGLFETDVPCERMKPLRDVSLIVRIWRHVQWQALVRRRTFRRRSPIGIPVP